jgi:MFS family permease
LPLFYYLGVGKWAKLSDILLLDGGLSLVEDRKPKFFYGWFIVLVAFCIQMIAWGIFTTFGVFFDSFLNEFGWARATISGAHSLAFFTLGFTGIVVGRLGDRFGPRMVMAGCGFLIGLGYLLMSQIGAIWQLYLFYGVVAGIGLSGTDVLLLSTVARWFVKKRGMMSGIAKIGTGIGMLIMPLVANWLISHHGWRTSYLILGSVALVLIVTAALFLRRDPGQRGLVPYGGEAAMASSLDAVGGGFSLREAIRTRPFWTISAIYLFILFIAQIIIIHIDPYAQDLGISAANAASILATIGGTSIVGRFIMGSAGDRLGNRLATSICFFIMMVAVFWLQWAKELWMLYLFAVIYGFAHGGFFALISPLVAELFGLSSHGVIFGIIIFSGTIGGAIGPLLAGRIFDVTGSYQLVFLIIAVVSVIAFVLSLLVRPNEARGLVR